MIKSVRTLMGYRVMASDGDAGKIDQVFFDDDRWVIRYLVVATGGLLNRRKVLISPWAVTRIDWHEDRVDVRLSKRDIESSPDIDTDQPVSRQMERAYFDYYMWPYYWEGPHYWGTSYYPGIVPGPPTAGVMPSAIPQAPEVEAQAAAEIEPTGDPHLRSSEEVIGYHIQALGNEEFGHVEDILFDDRAWAVRYLLVDTRNWWPGKSVTIAPQWISRFDWAQQKVHVNLTKDRIQNSPTFDMKAMDRAYEQELYRHYGYEESAYWIDEDFEDIPQPPRDSRHRDRPAEP
jgi:uncharacterized protein YrrD